MHDMQSILSPVANSSLIKSSRISQGAYGFQFGRFEMNSRNAYTQFVVCGSCGFSQVLRFISGLVINR